VKHQLNERKRKQEMIMEMAMQIDKVHVHPLSLSLSRSRQSMTDPPKNPMTCPSPSCNFNQKAASKETECEIKASVGN
jgi:hypothetical protein